MLSPERCPGPEEAGPEEVHDRRKCKSGGSAQVEEGQSSRRKVWSWTWKCPRPLVDLSEGVERNRNRPEPELDVTAGVGLCCRQDQGSGWTETGAATSGRYRLDMAELDRRCV